MFSLINFAEHFNENLKLISKWIAYECMQVKLITKFIWNPWFYSIVFAQHKKTMTNKISSKMRQV